MDVSADNPQYYDYLTSAYKQAVLELKAQMILSKAGKMALYEALKYHNKTIPNEILQD